LPVTRGRGRRAGERRGVLRLPYRLRLALRSRPTPPSCRRDSLRSTC